MKMFRCTQRTKYGTCLAYKDHKPRCNLIREALCPEAGLVPVIILVSILLLSLFASNDSIHMDLLDHLNTYKFLAHEGR